MNKYYLCNLCSKLLYYLKQHINEWHLQPIYICRRQRQRNIHEVFIQFIKNDKIKIYICKEYKQMTKVHWCTLWSNEHLFIFYQLKLPSRQDFVQVINTVVHYYHGIYLQLFMFTYCVMVIWRLSSFTDRGRPQVPFRSVHYFRHLRAIVLNYRRSLSLLDNFFS